MQILSDFLSNHVCSCSHDGGTPTFGPTTSTSASYSSLMRRARQESAALRSSFTSHHTAFTWPHPEVSCNMMQRAKGNVNLSLLAVAGCEVPDKGDCQSYAHLLLSLQHPTALVVTRFHHLFHLVPTKRAIQINSIWTALMYTDKSLHSYSTPSFSKFSLHQHDTSTQTVHRLTKGQCFLSCHWSKQKQHEAIGFLGQGWSWLFIRRWF